MKIRNGFVSNSSSSSFIVVAEDNIDVTGCKILDAIFDLKLNGSEEIKNYMLENFYTESTFLSCPDSNIFKKAYNQNAKVYIKDINYDEDYMIELIPKILSAIDDIDFIVEAN